VNERRRPLDGLVIVGTLFLAFMFLNVMEDQGWLKFDWGAPEKPRQSAPAKAGAAEAALPANRGAPVNDLADVPQPAALDADAIAAPYERFAVTQGIHGAEYDHMAIDISAGKGAVIHSPINGEVTALFIDEWGNPSLILENARYKIEMLHGLFTVQIGERVALGQPIGTESNQGNVADPWGFSCSERDCGYHTHINVFDKNLGRNVNPLELFHSQ